MSPPSVEGCDRSRWARAQEADSDCRGAQAECIKNCLYTCANYPSHLESSASGLEPPPPLALPLKETEQLVSALCMCATASVVRRIEALRELSTKQDADALGAPTRAPRGSGWG